jgi:flavin-dependent dehydrogenase
VTERLEGASVPDRARPGEAAGRTGFAVIGAGPGGAAAALALARGGAEVTLYRPARVREKPCGGAIPDAFLPTIDGFDWTASSAPSVEPRRLVLENAAGSRVEVESPGLRVFRRADFDAALAGAAVAAGATLVASRVDGIAFERDRVEVIAGGVRHRHAFVVAADGARGLARRSLGLAPGVESIGLGASLAGPVPDRLALGFPDAADAYCWVFPRPGGASVGVAYDAARLGHGAARTILDRFLDRHLDAGRSALDRAHRYRYPIPIWSSAVRGTIARAVRSRVLLVGDAAGVADPLTREGIRYALLSGRSAAVCLLAGTPGEYPESLDAGLAPELDRAVRAARLFYDEPLAQWMVPVARAHSGIRSVLGDLLTCRQSYRGLRRTLLRAAIGRYALPGSTTSTGDCPAP